MVIRSVNLETVCGITSKIPDNPFNEVAFAGKSNVGKSSMINALLNRKSLARTSAQPERRRPSIFTMSMMHVFGRSARLWICKDLCQREGKMGKNDRELSPYLQKKLQAVFC